MSKKLNKKGFTLIEVVLVLAIGGLIFLLAFIAFQQVSTNRRDTQRRNDAGRVLAELQNYKSDNNSYPVNVSAGGSMTAVAPPAANTFYNKYLGGPTVFQNPDNQAYTIAVGGNNAAPAKDVVRYTNGFKCDPAAANGISAEPGKIAVQIDLENRVIRKDDM